MRIRSLCTGYGGLDEAVAQLFGATLFDWSDVDPGPLAVMAHRHPGVPNLGDVKQIDWESLEYTELFTAGYPCQPFSNAGLRLGTEDPRHLWPWIKRGIGIIRPRIVVLENVAAHLRRGFDVVIADLAELRYDAAWAVVRASDVGAPHQRRRLFVVAVAQDSEREPRRERGEPAPRETEIRRARADAGGRSGMAAALAESLGRAARWDGSQRTGAELAQSLGAAPAADGSLGVPSAERFGGFAGAVARWENVLGVVAPEPTERGARGGAVLAPRFVEWMMGLPAGWVTDVPGLTRNAQLKLLGNGVLPLQAYYAVGMLYTQMSQDLERVA